jgi:mRNA-degrading endonuclease toxin of MazEF toxin-antitoxin module
MKRGDVVLVDYPFSEGGGSKVRPALVVMCENLTTVRQSRILKTLGTLPATAMSKIDVCLKSAFEIG